MTIEDIEEINVARLNPLDDIRAGRTELEVFKRQLDLADPKIDRALRSSVALFDHLEAAILALPGSPTEMRILTDVGIEHVRWLEFRGERVFKVQLCGCDHLVEGTWVVDVPGLKR